MEEEPFGGLMEVGIKDSSVEVFKVGMESFIVRRGINNMKVHGIMVFLTEKVHNTLIMDRSMKDPLNKISFMEREFSIS